MHNPPCLMLKAQVPVKVEPERFAITEPTQPPLHSYALAARPNQRTQLDQSLLNNIRGLRARRKPESRGIAPVLIDSFRANRMHCAHQSAKKGDLQCICT